MKKNFLLIMTLIALPTMGQQIIIEDTESYLNVIPRQFTVDNTPVLHFKYWDGDDTYISLYNDDIEKIEEFSIHDNHTFNYTLTYRTETREVKEITKIELKRTLHRELDEYYTFEEFIRDESFYGNVEVRVENGDTIVFQSTKKDISTRANYDYLFFGYEYFGTKYPLSYILCKENVLYQVKCRYDATYTDWVNAGERVEEHSCELPIIELDYDNFDGGNTTYNPDDKFILTQTLFNSDDKYEYIIPKVELTDISDYVSIAPGGDIQTLVLSRSELVSDYAYPTYKGFQVVSSDGTVLHDISFTGGFWMNEYDCNEINIITLGGKDYLVVGGYVEGKDGENINSMMFYRINRQTSSLHEVKSVPVSMRVKQQESTINVQLSDTSEASEIIMTNSIGKTIAKKYVPAGESMATFKASIPKGVYNITRFQHGQNIENGKIVLK